MTTAEFSNEFDTLVASYDTTALFGKQVTIAFDEFEKSQFLTSAQEELVTSLYSGKVLEGFESTEQVRRYLNSIVKHTYVELSESSDIMYAPRPDLKYYEIDLEDFSDYDRLMFITYEAVRINDTTIGCGNNSIVKVTPVRHDELSRIVNNPFRGPSASRVLRADVGESQLELISKYKLSEYHLAFVSRPTPIILVPLEEMTIDGENTVMQCTLDPALHRTILELAVSKAMQSKVSSSKTQG